MKKIFSSRARTALTMVTHNIVSFAAPEKIFLLSVIHRIEEPENIFLPSMMTTHAIDSFYLLVIAAETEARSNDDLQDIIEHHSAQNMDVTAYVMPVQQFNDWLMKDHPFAAMVYHQASLLYDAGITPLAIPNAPGETPSKKILLEALLANTTRAAEFLSGAGLFMARKQYPLAAFNLHQAAEQIYSGIIWFMTGLRVHTHNLDKLYRYCRHLVPGIQAIFPRDSGPEKELFRWLQKAYTDGRYKNDFAVKYMIVSQLSERLQKLLELCKTIPNSPTVNI